MMGYKKFYLVLSLFLCVCSLYAQDRLQRAVKEIKKGSVTTHVIPMVADVWGEIDGWVKSPYKTVYPHSWSKNKAVQRISLDDLPLGVEEVGAPGSMTRVTRVENASLNKKTGSVTNDCAAGVRQLVEAMEKWAVRR